MADTTRAATGGGAATFGGTTFQENVACYFSVLVLAETAAEPPASLGHDVWLTDVFAESVDPVDDIQVTTSAGGVLYIQAKTSLDLSPAEDSDLAKVLGQFVRQRVVGVGTEGGNRPLDPTRDRLILVVGHSTPMTIRGTFAAVLEKTRSLSTAAQLGALPERLNKDEQRALQIVLGHIQRQLASSPSEKPTGQEVISLLHVMHVLELDLRADGAHATRAKDLLRSTILSKPDRAGDAWRVLIETCRTFAPNRTGGDLAYLRAQLDLHAIQLRSVPSFRGDIDALARYTTDRLAYLRRLSFMKLSGRPVRITREVVQALGSFSAIGHTAVIGEPGAGKSGCLYEFAGELRDRGADVVLLTADMLKASTPEDLANHLGLSGTRSLVDVLQNWAGDGTAYLVVDALDAARAGMSLHVLCHVLHEVCERTPRWRIVASIREYDLRASPKVQDLFMGTPHPSFRDARFQQVRHVCVGLITPAELEQVALEHSAIASCLANAPSLTTLVRNLFNLSLLCDLIDRNVTQEELKLVHAQTGLLDLYWKRRVDGQDAIARELVLNAAVRQMVGDRALHVARLTLARTLPANTHTLDALLSDGVLVELRVRPDSPSSLIGFGHNILFDYAVCRLWLEGLSDTVVARLSEPENNDLLLAIRASISLAFEVLWHAEATRAPFWERALAFENAPRMRLIGKIIAASVAAQQFRVPADVNPILVQLQGRESPPARLLRFTIQAAITQHSANPGQFRLTGEGAAGWLALAVDLCEYLDSAAWEVRSILGALIRRPGDLTADQARHANQAARELLNLGIAEPRHRALVRPAIEVAAATIEAEPANTVDALSQVLTTESVRVGGHEWLHPMAEQLDVIARSRPAFALQIVDTVFGVTGDVDEQVVVGGRLLPLSMNKRDLVRMGRYDICKLYPSIMASDPESATRIMLRVMRAAVREHPSSQKALFKLPFRGKQSTLRPDDSYIWTVGDHNRHEEWWQILQAFQMGVQTLASEKSNQTLARVLDVLRDENELAVVWNAILLAACRIPETLGPELVDLLSSSVILAQVDTRTAAGELLHRAYHHLSSLQRQTIEAAINRIPDEFSPDIRECAERQRDRMIGCIPKDLIESDVLRLIRQSLEDGGGPPPNEPAFGISTSWDAKDDDWLLRRRGIQPDNRANVHILELCKVLRDFPEPSSSQQPEPDQSFPDVSILRSAVTAVTNAKASGADAPATRDLEDEILRASARLAALRGLRREMPLAEFIRGQLLTAARSEQPSYSCEDDDEWDTERPSRGCQSPRAYAARGLMQLATGTDVIDYEIVDIIQHLAGDEVPAVRYEVLSQLICLYQSSPELMWKLVARCCLDEPRIAILSGFCSHVLSRFPRADWPRLEPFVRQLWRRQRRCRKNDHVRGACAMFYLRTALWSNDSRGARYLHVMADRPFTCPVEVHAIITSCRDLIRFSDSALGQEENKRVRLWTFSFLTRVAIAVRSRARTLRAQHAGTSFDTWPEGDIGMLGQLHRMAHSVARELHFGSGAFDKDTGSSSDGQTTLPPTDGEKGQILEEARTLLDALCDVEFVESAYDVLQTLEFLIDSDPPGVIVWVAGLVRCSQHDGIQFESMAADLIVRIVERYLSEYGALFRTNTAARASLLDILDVFVGAGWPKATRLTYRLGEVFR